MKVTFSRPHYHYYVFSNYILIFFCFFTAYLLLKKPRILQRCLFIHFWPKIEQKYLLLRKNNDKLSICCNFLGYIIHYIYIHNIKYVLQVYLYRYISGADTGVRPGGGGARFLYILSQYVYTCLPCNHCSSWTWIVEEMLADGSRLRSTHFKKFPYFKICSPAYLFI